MYTHFYNYIIYSNLFYVNEKIFLSSPIFVIYIWNFSLL